MSNNQNQAATGIPTWFDRAAEANPGTNPQNWTARMKAKHMLDEIADLRAQLAQHERAYALVLEQARQAGDQLARQGQGGPICQVRSALFPCGWHDIPRESVEPNQQVGFETRTVYLAAPASAQPVATLAEHCESGALIIWHGPKPPEGSKLYLAAPASAQPAEDEILVLHRQLAAEKLRADQGWQRAEAKSRECIELRERIGGAQPDRGAAPDVSVIDYGNPVDKSAPHSQPVRQEVE